MATLEHGLNTIEQGSTNFRLLLNSNFSKLDKNRWNKITNDGDLPSVHKTDRFFYVTSNKKIYFDNGTTYDLVYNPNDTGSVSLLDLTDIPDSYVDQAGKMLIVNLTENGMEFVDVPTVIESFLGLSDTPNSFIGQAGKIVTVNALENALEFLDMPTSIDTFLGLTDTPIDYTGQGGKVVSVKSDASGLEFTTPSSGGSSLFEYDTTDTNLIKTTNIKNYQEGIVIGAPNQLTPANGNYYSRMFYSKAKNAFYAGYSTNANWNVTTANVGDYSTCFGFDTKASGLNATCFGYQSAASGNFSYVFGRASNATMQYSIAIGSYNNATGDTSGCFGYGNLANTYYAYAFGRNNYVYGQYSVAIGNDNTIDTSKNRSFILGNNNTIYASDSGAIGKNNSNYTEGSIGIGIFDGSGQNQTFVCNLFRTSATTTNDMIFLVSGLAGGYIRTNAWDRMISIKFTCNIRNNTTKETKLLSGYCIAHRNASGTYSIKQTNKNEEYSGLNMAEFNFEFGVDGTNGLFGVMKRGTSTDQIFTNVRCEVNVN